jgi:cell division protein FtsW
MMGNRNEKEQAKASRRPDYWLIGLMLALLVLGLEMVYSASFVMALEEYGDVTYFVTRQAMWAGVGLVLFLIFARLDYQLLRRTSALVMLTAMIGLVIVFVPPFGTTIYGATRWLRLGSLPPVQPSEFAKLASIIYISAWLAGKGEKLKHFSAGFVPFVLIVGTVAGLVLLQPDLGTTVVISLTAVTIFFVAGAELHHLILLAAAGSVAGFQFLVGSGYRQVRWQSFVDPWKEPQGYGFHIIQSLIALGSGGWAGLGLGASRQKFFYVPGSHTDAIFAIIGEELGFLGCLTVILLFAGFAYRGFKIALTAPDRFGRFLAIGITCWIVYQALINIGGITKSIPFTGIPLPFISSGGSSLAATMAATGVLVGISRYCEPSRSLLRKRTTRRAAQGTG